MADIIINNEAGGLEGCFSSADGTTVAEIVETMPSNGFLVDANGIIKNKKKLVLPAGTYTFRFKKKREGVKASDLLKFVGILIERVDGEDKILSCATSTTVGIVSVLHCITSYRELEEDAQSSWKFDLIPKGVSYIYRDPLEVKVDVPLQPFRFDHKRDLIVFNPATIQPQAQLSLRSPMMDEDRRVYFIHWSPHSSVKSGLLQDEGVVVGESMELEGQYLASLRSHGGSCGGGIFFKLDGKLVGIHQGGEHESEKVKGGETSDDVDVTRREFEELKGQKDAYTYFLGSSEIDAVGK